MSEIRVFACLSAFALLFAAQVASAGNRSFSGAFSPSDPTMAPGGYSCGFDEELPYQEAGVFQVTQSGDYDVSDVGEFGSFGAAALSDVVILIYDGPFNPAMPDQNLFAAVDFTFDFISDEEIIQLQAGTDYQLVVQRWCGDYTNERSAWGAVVRGPGVITGAGFASSNATFGNFANSNDFAVFPLEGGGTREYQYAVGDTFQAQRSGNHYYAEFGGYRQGGTPTLGYFYEGGFNPMNPSANFVGNAGFNGTIFLEAGKTYTVVLIDAFDEDSRWQYVLFPAGTPGIDTHINGSWFNPATEGQGVMMEFGPNTFGGFLFLAVFTYEQALPVKADTSEALTTMAVGAGDQRWFAGFGGAGTGDTQASLNFQNSSGGAFNSAFPEPLTDNNYGQGSIEIAGCDSIQVHYDLAGNVAGTLDLKRGLNQESQLCYDQTPAGPMTP